MGLFSRKSSSSSSYTPASEDTVRQIGQLVNQGRLDEADRLTAATDNPRDTAFRAFRYIDVESAGAADPTSQQLNMP